MGGKIRVGDVWRGGFVLNAAQSTLNVRPSDLRFSPWKRAVSEPSPLPPPSSSGCLDPADPQRQCPGAEWALGAQRFWGRPPGGRGQAGLHLAAAHAGEWGRAG